jgi:hypothetical protein
METSMALQDLDMPNLKIEIYNPSHKRIWDDFVLQSKNGHFLFFRDYMEYHSDRFQDSSLLIWSEKEELVALLPAHKQEEQFATHLGLTYGGFITNSKMKTPLMLEIFDATIRFLKERSYTSFLYKTIPHIHHKIPSEEDCYALFRMNAHLFRRNVFSVIQLSDKVPFQERRLRSINKAKQATLRVEESKDFESYWTLLTEVLLNSHQTKPVHTLSEITYLHNKFPGHIKLFACFYGTKMIAGVTIYEMENVAKTQYIASSLEGKNLGALDLVFDVLINDVYSQKKYFDFGPSDEDNGRYLNIGLIEQKEGFGARAITHDHYEIKL